MSGVSALSAATTLRRSCQRLPRRSWVVGSALARLQSIARMLVVNVNVFTAPLVFKLVTDHAQFFEVHRDRLGIGSRIRSDNKQRRRSRSAGIGLLPSLDVVGPTDKPIRVATTARLLAMALDGADQFQEFHSAESERIGLILTALARHRNRTTGKAVVWSRRSCKGSSLDRGTRRHNRCPCCSTRILEALFCHSRLIPLTRRSAILVLESEAQDGHLRA